MSFLCAMSLDGTLVHIGGFAKPLQLRPGWLIRRIVLLAAVLLVAGCGRKGPNPPGDEFLVVGIIDGDTIELEDGRKVRLLGIDTPERGDPGYDSASTAAERLLLRKRVRLEFGGEKIDRYGRTLAYLWNDNQLVNREIVREGWAHCYFYNNNLQHARELLLSQRQAMADHRALWRTPPLETAAYYRASFSSFRFHRPECESMSGVDADLEVHFESKESAFYDGYSPCSVCSP